MPEAEIILFPGVQHVHQPEPQGVAAPAGCDEQEPLSRELPRGAVDLRSEGVYSSLYWKDRELVLAFHPTREASELVKQHANMTFQSLEMYCSKARVRKGRTAHNSASLGSPPVFVVFPRFACMGARNGVEYSAPLPKGTRLTPVRENGEILTHIDISLPDGTVEAVLRWGIELAAFGRKLYGVGARYELFERKIRRPGSIVKTPDTIRIFLEHAR